MCPEKFEKRLPSVNPCHLDVKCLPSQALEDLKETGGPLVSVSCLHPSQHPVNVCVLSIISQGLIHYFLFCFDTRSSAGLELDKWAKLAGQQTLRNPLFLLPSPRITSIYHHVQLLKGILASSSGPHVGKASSLPTELSLRSLLFSFLPLLPSQEMSSLLRHPHTSVANQKRHNPRPNSTGSF